MNSQIARVVLVSVDDSGKFQVVNATGLQGEEFENIDRLQDYGFTSVPLPGTKGAIVCANGSRDNSIVIATDDGANRLINLSPGDVALYDHRGQTILLAEGGIKIQAPNDVFVTGDIIINGISLLQHTHDQDGDSDGNSQKPVKPMRNP